MINPSKTLIMISDSKECKFYEAIGSKITKLIKHLNFTDIITGHKRQSVRTGFYKKGSSPTHFFEPHSNPKELDRDDFCTQVIKELTHIDVDDVFSKIIIVADPKTLGVLRQDLPKSHKQKVTKEIHKDIIHLNQNELEVFLKEHY